MKSGSPKKRKKGYSERVANERAEAARKRAAAASSNASLLLRAIAYLIQFPDMIKRAEGSVRVPFEAVETDVEVEIDIDKAAKHIVFSVPPVVPVEVEQPLTHDAVRDILSLAGKHATLDDIAAWSDAQREEATSWAAAEYGNAAVEEPPFPKTLLPPEHVARLPNTPR